MEDEKLKEMKDYCDRSGCRPIILMMGLIVLFWVVVVAVCMFS